MIAGWTDDDSGLISVDLPLIVFGDHTRTFKYVEFPFVRGADGTQLLKPKDWIDPLYFYFACKALNLPSRGYNRHFKLLKEMEIRTPPLPDQREIGRILQQVEGGILRQDRQIETTLDLKRSAMRTLFTRGLRGERQKETEIGMVPECWEVVDLATLCVDTDSVDMRSEADRTIEYIDVSSISRDYLRIESTSRYVLKDAPGRARKRILTGDSIFATVRPTLLRVAVVPETLDNQVCSTAFCVLRRDPKTVVDNFLFYVVQRTQFVQQLDDIQTGASYPAVTDRMVKQQLVPLPSQDEQGEIVTILDAIDRKIDMHRRKRAVLEELFKALLHGLMTGEIGVGELGVAVPAPSEESQRPAYQITQEQSAVRNGKPETENAFLTT